MDSEDGVIHGMHMARHCPVVSHIFFADDSLLFFEASNQNASHILAILNAYSEASGQLINFNKSSIKFSPNTPVVKESISHLFGFEDMYPSAFYLGLPAALGRNKTIMFDFIRERALKKLKGWKSKNMSQSGGEVLIKSVIQAISSFAMQCFLLPSLINSIISSIRKFFGGGDSETRHIHWKAWDVITKSKDEGGLGFKNLHATNLAFLAKQGWRLLMNPNSFWARIMRGLYFPNGSFMTARKGCKPSWFWHYSSREGNSFVWHEMAGP